MSTYSVDTDPGWGVNGEQWYHSTYVLAMLLVVLVESMFLVLQAAKSYASKSVNDLSAPSYLVFLFTGVMWLAWGAHTRDVPLVASGVMQTVGSGAVLGAIYVYSTH
jgi:uncharacterized protein with PQ loop repeat